MMNRTQIPILLLTALAVAGPAFADCTVTYKAKQDDPLKLEAGSTSLPDDACQSQAAAAAALAPILAQQGWTLLAITSIVPSD